jgi:translation initiation factor 1
MTKPKNPFSALESMRDLLPPSNKSEAAHQNNIPAKPIVGKPAPVRAVVRMERKGRGGKEATVIEKLELAPKLLEEWCRDLKQALGCGGTVEEDTIVLQGDLRPRVAAALTAKGVGKVTIG